MKDFFYRCLMFLAKRFGAWIFLPIAWPVATGYFLFFPVASSSASVSIARCSLIGRVYIPYGAPGGNITALSMSF